MSDEVVTITRAEYDRLQAVVREVELRRQHFNRRDVYPARWDGRCSQCEGRIYRGDPMVKVGDREVLWVHPGTCEAVSADRATG